MNRFLDFREKERQKLLANPALTPGDVITLNLTIVEGGVQLNVVPSELAACKKVQVTF